MRDGCGMSQQEKLIEKARNNPGGLSFSELARLAEYFGYGQVRQRGSHRIFSRGAGSRRFNFQDDHGEAKVAQVKEFVAYLEDQGWL